VQYGNFLECLADLWRSGGLSALYRGFAFNLMKVPAPHCRHSVPQLMVS
jgi:hypothetical protein